MAVTLTKGGKTKVLKPTDAMNTLEYLQVPGYMIHAMIEDGVQAYITETSILVKHNKKTLVKKDFSPDIIKGLKDQTMGESAKGYMRDRVANLIESAFNSIPEGPKKLLDAIEAVLPPPGESGYSIPDGPNKFFAALEAVLPVPEGTEGTTPGAVDPAYVPKAVTEKVPAPDSGPKVALKYATELLQPVGGTSGGSVYFCVALSETLNAAVRYKGTKVSFRIEGKQGIPEEVQALLDGLGFVNHDSYASIHVGGVTPELYPRTVGALIFGLQHPFAQIYLNPIVLQGEGQ